MSPENDFNISRVESLQQIAGLKPVEDRGEKKRQQNTAKKQAGKHGRKTEELIDETEQSGEDEMKAIDEEVGNGHSIDYCA